MGSVTVQSPSLSISGRAAGDPRGIDEARNALSAAAAALTAFAADDANVRRIAVVAELLAARFQAGGKVLICGNGGSACDAAHFAEELTGRFRQDRRPLPAIACTDPGHITCTANDYGFEQVFARWVEALGRPDDVLILLSTSGNSPNIVAAAEAGKRCGLVTISLLGKSGGELRGRCDHEWVIGVGSAAPPLESDRIQEVHMLVLHTLIELVERRMFAQNYPG